MVKRIFLLTNLGFHDTPEVYMVGLEFVKKYKNYINSYHTKFVSWHVDRF